MQAAKRWPKGVATILFLELWERFSYYGMRSLLLLYMTSEMHLPVNQAGKIYGLYTGLAYLLPVLGGLLADRVIGERRAILWGGVSMAAGHLLLVCRGWPAFVAALTLLVVGTGLFKANTAALLGKLYAPDDRSRDSAYAWFYLTVNLGALLAPLLCGSLAARERWHLGFGAAGLGMLLGLCVWLMGQRAFGSVGLAPKSRRAAHGAAGGRRPLSAIERDRMRALATIAVVGNISLWAAIGQAGSTLTLFADRETNRLLPLFDRMIPASSLQATNPFFIILGVPLMTLLWRTLAKRQRLPSPPMQMAIGLALVGLGFATMALAGQRVDHGGKVSLAWLLVATLLNTAGELCVSPLGLSLVSRLAPPQLSSVAMGLWYASMALANGLSGFLAGLYERLDKATLFLLPTVWCLVAAAILVALRGRLQRWLHEAEGPADSPSP